jgi:hypothetical protein
LRLLRDRGGFLRERVRHAGSSINYAASLDAHSTIRR